MLREKSSGIIVFRRNQDIKYLLLHYEQGHWEFSKGNIEKDESEEQTARRELVEETGIEDVKLFEGFREKINYFYRRQGKTVSKEVIFLLGETKSKDVKLSHEHTEYNWLTLNESLELLTFDNSRKTLKNADNFLRCQLTRN